MLHAHFMSASMNKTLLHRRSGYAVVAGLSTKTAEGALSHTGANVSDDVGFAFPVLPMGEKSKGWNECSVDTTPSPEPQLLRLQRESHASAAARST